MPNIDIGIKECNTVNKIIIVLFLFLLILKSNEGNTYYVWFRRGVLAILIVSGFRVCKFIYPRNLPINTNANAPDHSLPLHPLLNVLISMHQVVKYLSCLADILSMEAQRGGKSAFLFWPNIVKDGHPHGGCSYVMFSLFQSFLLGTLLFKMCSAKVPTGTPKAQEG